METLPAAFHPHGTADYHDHLIAVALSGGQLAGEDADVLRKYINHAKATRGISPLRATKLTQTMISWRQFFTVSWKEASIDDLLDARNQLDCATSSKGKPYSKNTRNDHVRILKNFYTWAIKRKLSSISKEDLAEIRAPGTDTDTTKARDLLTTDDVTRMIEACKTIRDKAIIAVLYESGCRIGELARLTWGDVRFDDYGVKLSIPDSKTDQTRYTRLLMCTEHLAAWRNGYYGIQPTGEAILFVTTQGGPLEYRAIAQVITRAGERAGVTKRVHPHLFRKTRITDLVRQGYQESVIKEMMWGNLSTNMFRTYVKLSEKDIDNEILRKAGIKTIDEDPSGNLPRQCKYCFAMNAPTSRYCHMCTRPLTEEAAKEMEVKEGGLTMLVANDAEAGREVVRRLIQEEMARVTGKSGP